ncbi:endopeptidase La, partial [bacterium]
GKTSLGRSIAEALGRKFVRASLGGVKDEAEIRGHRRTYVGSMPGKIIQEIARAGVNNPVFLLDEVDKIGVDYRGDPASALLEVLDPEVNQSFMDHYIEIGYDLSHVLFITTANVTYSIPPPLLDRMEIINLPGYLEFEKIEIAKRHLIPKIIEDTGLRQRDFRVSDGVIKKIIKEYTQEAGVRNLERSLRKIARKIAREKAFGSRRIPRITTKNIEDFLGVPKFKGFKKKQGVGVATGLAWTPVGGEVIQVETRVMDGEGNLILTGQMGDVMKESAMAALSVIRSNYKRYGLNRDFYRKLDVHVHIPEGAVPKDGPSAGVTIFSSILSALTKKQTRGDVAMTGEITLSGRVLGVGGLTAKLMAARSAGIKKVILPIDNERDIKEVPEAVKAGLNLIFVKNTEDVVENAF